MTFYKAGLLIILLSIYRQCYSQEILSDSKQSSIKSNDKYLTANGDTIGTLYKRHKRVESLLKLGIDSLINRFDGNWEFEETGKAYWIGYTDEMYAIATFNDSAIYKLENFIEKSHNLKSITGAIYCIHLIGINSTVAGRFYEEFTNINARNSLLNLIKRDSLLPIIIPLLARDPWPTDIATLSQMLQTQNSAVLVNALFRYPIESIPFREDIGKEILKVKIELATSTLADIYIGDVTKVTSFNSDSPNEFTVYDDETDIRWKFIPNKTGKKIICDYFKCKDGNSKKYDFILVLSDMFKMSLMKNDAFSYCDFDKRFFHFMKNKETLVICDIDVTRQRWLQFFKNRNLYKNGY